MPYLKTKIKRGTDWARSIYEDYNWVHISEEEASQNFDPDAEILYVDNQDELRDRIDMAADVPPGLTICGYPSNPYRRILELLRYPLVASADMPLDSVLAYVPQYNKIFVRDSHAKELFPDIDVKHVTPLYGKYIARPSPSPRCKYITLERDPKLARTLGTRNARAAERAARKAEKDRELRAALDRERELERARAAKTARRKRVLEALFVSAGQLIEHELETRYGDAAQLRIVVSRAPENYRYLADHVGRYFKCLEQMRIPVGRVLGHQKEPLKSCYSLDNDDRRKLLDTYPSEYVKLFGPYRDIRKYHNDLSLEEGVDHRDPELHKGANIRNEIEDDLVRAYADLYKQLKRVASSYRRSHG